MERKIRQSTETLLKSVGSLLILNNEKEILLKHAIADNLRFLGVIDELRNVITPST